MKKLLAALLLCPVMCLQAQIGVGTTSPNSTLDVRGSLSTPITTFTGNTTATISDNLFLFTGTATATLTLPTAVGITGREYWIKNLSSNSSTLNIATTSAQTIDGLASWSLTQTNKAIRLVSNGTNWYAAAESLPGSTGTPWVLGGNNVVSMQNFGTTSNFALPFITNNTERMRLNATGSLGIGTSTFNGINPERLIVDAGTNGSGAFQNVIVGKGNTNSYAQLNIQNNYTGSAVGTIASSDVVATADNGNETVNYIDMGINTSGNNASGVLGGANTAYLYSTGNDFSIGNGTSAKNLNFFTTAGGVYTERMRIDGSGNVGIGTSTPSQKLEIVGNLELNGAFMPGGSAGSVGTFLISTGAGSAPTWFDASGYAWVINGNSVPSIKTLGTTNAYDLPFITNNTEKMRITSAGTVGIGTSTFNGTNPEELIVDAGTGSGVFQNVIVGKGNTNSYAQLNIQNMYSGIAAGTIASSDVVATSDNGNESVNFIDMGINSSGNNSTGILGGANTAYLYSTGNDFSLGNATAAKDLILFTGGTATTNERLRATANGVTVTGSMKVSFRSGTGAYTVLATDYVVINTGGAATWT
ncbi:MAG: hypothetical protein ABI688_06770, partial [Bacteroidota bacterium]